METGIRQNVAKKRSDWCKALSCYSDQQKICKNCILMKEQLTYFVLPKDKAAQKLSEVDLKAFSKSLELARKPVLLVDKPMDAFSSFLVYVKGNADFEPLFEALSITKLHEKPAATIISPDYFSKSNQKQETLLVREIQQYFDPTGFIKLPLLEINELMSYAISEACEVLLLPFDKLPTYLESLVYSSGEHRLPAAFYPSKLNKTHQIT